MSQVAVRLDAPSVVSDFKRDRWWPVGVTRTLVLVYLLLSASAVRSAELSPARLGWSVLEFEAAKLMMKASARVKAEAVPTSLAKGDLRPAAKFQVIEPRSDSVVRLQIGSKYLGRTSDATLLIEPASAATLQREATATRGQRRRHKVERRTMAGMYTERREWTGGNPIPAARKWPVTSQEELSVDCPSTGPCEIADPAALLYIVSVARLEESGDRERLWVLAKGKTILVEATVVGLVLTDRPYLLQGPGMEGSVEGNRLALQIRLEGQCSGAGCTGNDLRLMGLQGDVELLLEKESRIPLLISGRLPRLGRINFRLRRAVAGEVGGGRRSGDSSTGGES